MDDKVSAIILAAGLSTRFPGDKMLYKLKGKPMISWSTNKVLKAGVNKAVVVVGHRYMDVVKAVVENTVDTNKIVFVYNKNYMEGGMSSSIKKGLNILCPGEHILIHPGDIPCVKTGSIKKVLREGLKWKAPITVAAYNGRHSHPIMFNSKMINELKNIGEETHGLKGIVKKYWSKIRVVETGDPGTLRDIDSPGDIEDFCYDSLKE